jgi:S1-C subfamily serine protease
MIIDSDGTILTDNHVISRARFVNIYLKSGAIFVGTVIAQNSTDDLATVKIADTNLPTVTFGDSNESALPLGSTVTALGYPLTCNVDQTLEVDQGLVTARRVSTQLGADLIQTSARINPGDSGGPLVDNFGNVIGINESILTVEDLDLNVTGIAIATPSTVLTSFINNPSYSNPVYDSSYGTSQPTPTTVAPSPSFITPSPSEEAVNVSLVVDNSEGGIASPSDFKITVIGSNPSISSFVGSATSREVLFDAKSGYGINISFLPNYTELTNGNCADSGGLPPGGITDCVIRETFLNSSSQN